MKLRVSRAAAAAPGSTEVATLEASGPLGAPPGKEEASNGAKEGGREPWTHTHVQTQLVQCCGLECKGQGGSHMPYRLVDDSLVCWAEWAEYTAE